MNNFEISLDWDLRQIYRAIEALKPLYRLHEIAMDDAWREAKRREEEFRKTHQTMCELRMRSAELEEERFRTEEDREDWRH